MCRLVCIFLSVANEFDFANEFAKFQEAKRLIWLEVHQGGVWKANSIE